MSRYANTESQGSVGNYRGKHTKSPGYQAGNHWVVCDNCGFDIRAADIRETWDGRQVCPSDWEPRQPQDFVRSKQEVIAARDPVRPEPVVVFLGDECNNTALAGIAICGIVLCGVGCGRVPQGFVPTVPTGTL